MDDHWALRPIGYSSPILESLSNGYLQQVADRLEKDDTLYQPA